MIRPYLSDIINDYKTQGERKICSGNTITEHKTQGEWKIHLTMAINFISSKDSDETRTMHTKSDKIVVNQMVSESDEITEELFKSLLQRYQEGLEESMRGSEFIFDSVDALYYDLSKISLNRGGTYIDSPESLKNKNATINPQNKNKSSICCPVCIKLSKHQKRSRKNIKKKIKLLLISIIEKK